MDFIFQWIDLFWLLLVPLALGRRHWITGAGYVLSCVLMLRLETDLMLGIGYPYWILPFLHGDVFTRGLVVYGVIFLLYFLWAHFLRRVRAVIFLGHSIAFFFIAIVSSMLVMVL